QVGPESQTEAVEPVTVGGIAAEACVQVSRAIPAVGAPYPAGVFDRQRRGVDLLPEILGDGREHLLPQQLERTPQPASPSIEFTLGRQVREQAGPLASDLRQEAAFA